MDDFLLFAADKRILWEWQSRIAEFLRTLRLVTHPRKTVIYPVTRGMPFLGWNVFPTHRRVKRANALDFTRRLREQVAAFQHGEITLADLTMQTRAWIAHVEHGDTRHLRAHIFHAIPISPA